MKPSKDIDPVAANTESDIDGLLGIPTVDLSTFPDDPAYAVDLSTFPDDPAYAVDLSGFPDDPKAVFPEKAAKAAAKAVLSPFAAIQAAIASRAQKQLPVAPIPVPAAAVPPVPAIPPIAAPQVAPMPAPIPSAGSPEAMLGSLATGTARMGANVARTPALLYDIAALPQNMVAQATGLPIAAQAPEWLRNNPLAQYYDKVAASNDYLKQRWGAKNEDFSTVIKRKDPKEIAAYIGHQVIVNAPQQAAIVGMGVSGLGKAVLPVMGGISAAESNEEMRGKNVNPANRTANAMLTGTIEGAAETLGTFGLLKSWEEALAKSFSSGVRKRIWKDVFKTITSTSVGEANEEMVTSFAQDFSKVLSGVDPNAMKGSVSRALEAALVGGISGMSMTSPAAILSGRNIAKEYKASDLRAANRGVAKAMQDQSAASDTVPEVDLSDFPDDPAAVKQGTTPATPEPAFIDREKLEREEIEKMGLRKRYDYHYGIAQQSRLNNPHQYAIEQLEEEHRTGIQRGEEAPQQPIQPRQEAVEPEDVGTAPSIEPLPLIARGGIRANRPLNTYGEDISEIKDILTRKIVSTAGRGYAGFKGGLGQSADRVLSAIRRFEAGEKMTPGQEQALRGAIADKREYDLAGVLQVRPQIQQERRAQQAARAQAEADKNATPLEKDVRGIVEASDAFDMPMKPGQVYDVEGEKFTVVDVTPDNIKLQDGKGIIYDKATGAVEIVKKFNVPKPQTTNLKGEQTEEIFIKPFSPKSGATRNKDFAGIPPKEGYEIVYKPYGQDGEGFYYSRVIESKAAESPEPDMEAIKSTIEQAGGKFVGVWKDENGKPNYQMVSFNEPLMGSTLTLPADQVTTENVKAKFEEFAAKVREAKTEPKASLVETPEENFNQRFERYQKEALEQGLNQPQAEKYARDRMARENVAKQPAAPAETKPKQEGFSLDGVQGFGTGRKGETDLFAGKEQEAPQPPAEAAKPLVFETKDGKRITIEDVKPAEAPAEEKGEAAAVPDVPPETNATTAPKAENPATPATPKPPSRTRKPRTPKEREIIKQHDMDELYGEADEPKFREVSKKAFNNDISALRNKYEKMGVRLIVYPQYQGGALLSLIDVPVKERGKGIATQAMNELTSIADRHNEILTLSPTSEFGANKSRLESFYRRFGFTSNKGRLKNYKYREMMIRYPSKDEPKFRIIGGGSNFYDSFKNGSHYVEVFKNPRESQIPGDGMRAIVMPNGDMLYWDAEMALHQDVIDNLDIPQDAVTVMLYGNGIMNITDTRGRDTRKAAELINRHQDKIARMIGEYRLSSYNMGAVEQPKFRAPDLKGTPGFYSKLRRTIEDKMPEKASVQQVQGLIKDAKAEERKWTGIDDFLQGKAFVSKAELLDYLKGNEIEVKEVTKGEIISPEREKYLRDRRENGTMTNAEQAEFISMVRSNKTETKYSRYTLPGGKNYRELLFTVPEKSKKFPAFEEWVKSRHYLEEKYNTQAVYEAEKEAAINPDSFHSTHWAEPNVIAHVRVNDRTTPDGKKALFVEEVQSDWAREGREKGFIQPLQNILSKEEATKLYIAEKKETIERLKNTPGHLEDVIANQEYLDEAIKNGISDRQYRAMIEKVTGKSPSRKGVPPAPLLKNWQEFVLKKILMKAAAEGYDAVSWVTGEQTAERYDLSKHLSQVRASKNDSGMNAGKYMIEAIDHNGKTVIEQPYSQEELPSAVGKELASKIVDSLKDKPTYQTSGLRNAVKFSGLDLKVGGEWAKTLYDKQIPNIMNDLGKKWGARVGEIELQTDQLRDMALGDTINDVRWPGGRKLKQLSLPITPEMRKGIQEEGFPLFRAAENKRIDIATLTPSQKQRARDIVHQVTGTLNVKFLSLVLDNPAALGAYRNGAIYILDGKANQTNKSAWHEGGHYYLDEFATDEERKDIYTEVKNKFRTMSAKAIEEKVVETFARYADYINNRKANFKDMPFSQKLYRIFKAIIQRIKNYFKHETAIRKLYKDMLSQEWRNRVPRSEAAKMGVMEPIVKKGGVFRARTRNTNPFPNSLALPFEEGVPSQEKVATMKNWLNAHSDKYKNEYVTLYHGTGANLPIAREGLKPTSSTRRRSFQSRSGYVYLAPTPERAKNFGDLGNSSNSKVYAVTVLVRNLKADTDQLNNLRSTGAEVGNSVAESLVYGGSARVEGAIEPWAVKEIESDTQSRDITQTEAFKKWFGESKVVDGSGKPLVMYHATAAQKLDNKFTRRGSDIGMHFGTQGQSNDRIAYKHRYENEIPESTRTYPVYLKITNPLRLRDAGWWSSENLKYELTLPDSKFTSTEVNDALRLAGNNESSRIVALRKLIEKKGYDGIVYKNTGETEGGAEYAKRSSELWQKLVEKYPETKTSAISIEIQKTPEHQAYAKNEELYKQYREDNAEDSYIVFYPTQIKSATGNTGAFDPNNPDIRYRTIDNEGEKSNNIGEDQGDLFDDLHKPETERVPAYPTESGVSLPPIETTYKQQGYIYFPKTKIGSPQDIAFAFQELEKETSEYMYVVGLRGEKPVSVELISIGSVGRAAAYPYEGIDLLAKRGATSYYLLHNHPAGSVDPPTPDIQATEAVRSSYKNIGMKFKGHVIIDHDEFGFIDEKGEHSVLKLESRPDKGKPFAVEFRDTKWGIATEQIKSPQAAANFVQKLSNNIGDKAAIICVDAWQQVRSLEIADKDSVDVKKIVLAATSARSNGVIVYNQEFASPMGLYRQLRASDIKLFDIVALTKSGYTSERERGNIWNEEPIGKYGVGEGEGQYRAGTRQERVAQLKQLISQHEIPPEETGAAIQKISGQASFKQLTDEQVGELHNVLQKKYVPAAAPAIKLVPNFDRPNIGDRVAVMRTRESGILIKTAYVKDQFGMPLERYVVKIDKIMGIKKENKKDKVVNYTREIHPSAIYRIQAVSVDAAATSQKAPGIEEAITKVGGKLQAEGDTAAPPIGMSVKTTRQRPDDTVVLPADKRFAFGNPDFERQYQAAKGVTKDNIWNKVRAGAVNLYHAATRTYTQIPNTAEYAGIKDILTRQANNRAVAREYAIRFLQAITKDLGAKQFDIFTRKIILDDLAWDVEQGKELPLGLDSKTLSAEKEHIDEIVRLNPAIEKALKQRKDIQASILSDLLKYNILKPEQVTNPDYFHHQVLEYANIKGLFGTGQKLHTPSPGFARGRHGTTLAINTDYLQAEYEYMIQAIHDIRTAQNLEEVESSPLNIKQKLVAEAKAKSEETGKDVSWRSLVPDGYKIWQPKEGRIFYVAKAIPEQLFDEVYAQIAGAAQPSAMDDELGPLPNRNATLEDFAKNILAVGQRRKELVLPEGVAYTLDHLYTKPPSGLATALIDAATRIPVRLWKQWVLFNPMRLVKYNWQNALGDLDAMLAANPGATKRIGQAHKELYAYFYGDQPMTADMRAFFERGGMQTGQTISELPELKESALFSRFYEKSIADQVNIVKRWFRSAGKVSVYRENVLRYAMYLDYLDRYRTDNFNTWVLKYGASNPEEVDALPAPEDKAARVATDAMGDYANVSEMGKEIRTRLIPFYSWLEVNFKRYPRLLSNAFKEGKGKGAGATGRVAAGGAVRVTAGLTRFALTASLLWVLAQLWNNLRFKDVEDDLSEYDKRRMHITLGRDKNGKPMFLRGQGALADYFEWFGLNEFPRLTQLLAENKINLAYMLKTMAKSPLNKLLLGISPIQKIPIEYMLGVSFFPDVTEPRAVRDKVQNLFRNVQMDDIYNWMTGKPMRPLKDTIRKATPVVITDHRSNAYSDVMNLKRLFLKKQGKDMGGFNWYTPRSQASYNYKLALKYKDKKAQAKYLQKMKDLHMTGAQFRATLKTMDPLAGLSYREKREFVGKYMTQDDRRKLKLAMEYYKQTLAEMRSD